MADDAMAGAAADTAYYLYHYNQVGSTTQVTDGEGNLVYSYAYSPYGERMGTYDGDGNRIPDDTPIRFLYNGQAGVETDGNGLYYMRARYYNTDIKRFMNRDILNGTIDNGQSLNKYSYVQGNPVSLTDPFGLCPIGGSINEYLRMLGHTVLDLLGFVPVVGFVADLANAYWYYREGNTFQMAASIVAAIPGFGDAVGGIIKGAGFVAKCERTIKVGKAVSATCRMVGAVAQTGVNMINFDRAFRSVRQEYRETGHVSFLNGANAVLSALGVVGGVAQSVNSIRSFNRMRSNLSNKRRSTPSEMARSWQGSGKYPGIDNYTDIIVEKGTILYRGEPNGTEYFTTLDAIEQSGRDATKIFEGLQVEKNPIHGYRGEMQGYLFNKNITSAYGVTKANPQFGKGGLPQYYVPDAQNLIDKGILTPVDKIKLYR